MIIQIETAGSLWIEDFDALLGPRYGNRMHIVCSPKTPSIHPMIEKNATAFKYVIGSTTEVQGYAIKGNTQIKDGPSRELARPRTGAPIYLSPMDEYSPLVNEMNRARVADLCLQYGWIAGVQMHKLLNIKEPV